MSVSSNFNNPIIKIAENLIDICKDETVNPFVREAQIEDSVDQIEASFFGMKYADCQGLNDVLKENLLSLATLKEKTGIPNYQKELFETLYSTVQKTKAIVNNHLKIQDLLQNCKALEKDQAGLVDEFIEEALKVFKNPQKYEQEAFKEFESRIQRLLVFQINELNKFWDHFQKSGNRQFETEETQKKIEETEEFIEKAFGLYQKLIKNSQTKELSEKFMIPMKNLAKAISNAYNFTKAGTLSKTMQEFLNISLSNEEIFGSALRKMNKDFLNDFSFNTVASPEMPFFDQGFLEVEYIKRLNEDSPLKDLKIDINKISNPRLIKRLNLTNCEISLVKFSRFENLEYLDLHSVQGLSVEQINSLPESLKELTWPHGFDVSGVDFSRLKRLKKLCFVDVKDLTIDQVNNFPETLEILIWQGDFNAPGMDFSRLKRLKEFCLLDVKGLTADQVNNFPETLEILTFLGGFNASGGNFSRLKRLKKLCFLDVKDLTTDQVNNFPDTLEYLVLPKDFNASGVDFSRLKRLKEFCLLDVKGLTADQLNNFPETLEILIWQGDFNAPGMDFSRLKRLKQLILPNAKGLTADQVNNFSNTLEDLALPDDFNASGVDFSRLKRLKEFCLLDAKSLTADQLNNFPETLEILILQGDFNASGVDFSRLKRLKELMLPDAKGLTADQVNNFSNTLEVLTLPDDFNDSGVDFSRLKRLS